MTITTLTVPEAAVTSADSASSSAAGASSTSLPVLTADKPSLLQDEACLQRLANQLFALLPGADTPAHQVKLPDSVHSISAPVTPATVQSAVNTSTAELPVAGLFDIPAGFSPALPALDLQLVRPVSALSSPPLTHYFIAESAVWRSSGRGVESAIPPLPEMPTATRVQSSDEVNSPAGVLLPAAPHYYFLQRDHGANPTTPDAVSATHAPAGFDINAVRRDFPILSERINGRPLIWLDNAATTHKPQAVIDRIAHFYAHENSNIHRAAHALAARATDAYEAARLKVAGFLGAASPEEIVFVRGATEGINLLAHSFGERFIHPGDEIIVSHLEHHANIVPWQQLSQRRGAVVRVIPVDNDGQIILSEYLKLLNGNTRLVAITQVSNALGTITPVREIIRLAHQAGAKVLVDGAQAVSHMRVNVQALDADFYVFSGHKVYGPTGIGAVYGKRTLLEELPPWQGGGNMIREVTFEHTEYHGAPARFEAGTGNIADAVGLGAAIDYVERIGMDAIAHYEHGLLLYATHHLRSVPGLQLIGTAPDKAGVISFTLRGHTTESVGKALNQEGIAVRSGHHCAQPILRRFGVESTVRPSLAFYNTCQEIDALVYALRRLQNQ